MATPGRRQGDADGPDDGELVRRSLAGDRGAFEVLVRRHQRLVFRIAGGFLRNRADVEEVAKRQPLCPCVGPRGRPEAGAL